MHRHCFGKHFRENELSAKLKALDAKYNSLIAMVEKDDQFLDVRVQLDLMDLKTDMRSVMTQMELLDPKKIESVAALRDSVKQEIFFLNKRLHENQREHAMLSERIGTLEKSQPKT